MVGEHLRTENAGNRETSPTKAYRLRGILALALGFAVIAPPPVSIAETVQDVVELPVTVTNTSGRVFTHTIKVTVFRDERRTRAPFLLLNHGRAARSADRAKLGRVKYTENANYFASKGFVVFVPTRVGYGVTGGADVEYSGACSKKNYPPVYEAAAQ